MTTYESIESFFLADPKATGDAVGCFPQRRGITLFLTEQSIGLPGSPVKSECHFLACAPDIS